MKLLSIHLENFRQHTNSRIQFHDGMTAIVGANGTGKSTILEAITFALYGEQRDKKETIRFYWSDKKRFSVTLRFSLADREYVVERTHDTASLVDLTNGNRVLATGLSDVSKSCQTLLALSYEQFINSFCAEQKGLAFLQFRTNAARQEEVARMLGFDRIKAAEEQASANRREAAIQREVLERGLASMDDLLATKDAATARLAEITAKTIEATKRAKELAKELESATAHRHRAEEWQQMTAEMNSIRERAAGLKKALEHTERELESAKRDVEELAVLIPKEAEYLRVRSVLEKSIQQRKLDEKRRVYQTELDRLAEDVVDLNKRIERIARPDIDALRDAYVASQKEIDKAQIALRSAEHALKDEQANGKAQLAVSESEAAKAAKDLAHAQEMIEKGICPECGQEIGESFTQHLTTHTEALAAAKQAVIDRKAYLASLGSTSPAILQATEQIATAKRTSAEAQASLERGRVLESDSKSMLAQLEALHKKQEQIQAQIASCPPAFDMEAHARLEQQERDLQAVHYRYVILQDAKAKCTIREEAHVTARTEHDSARTRYRELDELRKTLPIEDSEAATQAIARHEALREESSRHESLLRSSAEMRTMAEEALSQSNARIEEQKARLEQIREAKRDETLYEVIAKEMRALRLDLNRSIVPDLAARASENLSLLTNGRYPLIQLDKNFGASLLDDGVIKQVISGGEEDVVALSLRLALSELIQEQQGQPMSLLVLDEVFGSLDGERRQSVLERLASLKGRFEQILVISHIEEINQVADQCIYLSRDPDTRSTTVSDAPLEAGSFGLLA